MIFKIVIVSFSMQLLLVYSKKRYEVTEPDVESPQSNGNGSVKWMLMPDGRDNVQPAVISGLQPNDEVISDVDSVKFYLFTRDNANKAEVRSMNKSCLPVFKYFKNKKKTKILIHGFGDNVKESYMVPTLKDAFLSRGDFNIIAVDWSNLASKPWYNKAVENTHPVAKHVAAFIDHMSTSTDTKAKNVHLVGFSLGAHVAGMTASNVKSGRIRHITGLDPAYILYSKTPPERRLDSSQADLVEVVHTSGGYVGFEKPLGHRDFFPNGGVWPQPGCVIDYAAVCSHRRAYYYYGEAIAKTGSFLSISCESYEHFVNDGCKADKNRTIDIGDSLYDTRNKGLFYLNTKPESPYGEKPTDTDSVEELQSLFE
ncbi:pancreatic lipase-related protein 2-like [Planococcus citri]|uniref:pancreatic lipase-related protein 2-like n=1 Tax=Planococcus citri TaxID=170843 RepID=UPI0031F9CEF3